MVQLRLSNPRRVNRKGLSETLASTVATVERQARHAKREIRGVGGKSMSLFGRAAGAGKAVAAAMLEGVVGLFEGIFGAARPELNPEQKQTVHGRCGRPTRAKAMSAMWSSTANGRPSSPAFWRPIPAC
jgi:hypothetical protein